MPKIPQSLAEDMEGGLGEGGPNREPVDGYCLAKVIEVDETDPNEDSGYAGQNIKFEVVLPKRHEGDYVWDYLSYSPKAAWKFRALFDATGYTYDSDTDELVEEEELVILECHPELQERGKNKGKMRTKVDNYYSPDDEEIKALID